jgi:hypothetical protein
MKARSSVKLNTYELDGNNLSIYWNEEYHEPVSDIEDNTLDSREAYWTYDHCYAFATDDYGTLIEKIIATKYPTYGSEIAALANGSDSAAKHKALRKLAKELASGWVNR